MDNRVVRAKLPTSATGSLERETAMLLKRRIRGFTLIEVLVAVAIVAIVAGIVVIGMSGLGGGRGLALEAKRLHSRIEFACELALLNGHSMGLMQTTDHGYRFVERLGGHWQPLQDADALGSYTLPSNVQLQLQRDDRVVPPADEDAAQWQPQIACMASGEMTPFTATLAASGADQHYRIVGHIDARTELSHVPLQP